MSKHNRRKAARLRRQRRNILLIVACAALVLAIGGLAVWLATDRAPGIVMQHYPMDDAELVRLYARMNELPPAYLASVILAESDYDPNAVSSANAQGLMQLLPSTAEWIAGKLGETYTEGCLFDPDTNLRYGCWYLSFLYQRYAGDMRLASAAYHAGQGNVDKWLQDPTYSTDGKTLNSIPFSSTDTYVQRIMKFYEKYDELYQA